MICMMKCFEMQLSKCAVCVGSNSIQSGGSGEQVYGRQQQGFRTVPPSHLLLCKQSHVSVPFILNWSRKSY